ncbi:ATP-grasp domain-containing protein [Streptomyces sp. NBC_01017]|uniref:ATP-grasp domain-containing protein n=1 Tax=Streptomyces sp. NBC_01017 TaxID=2903721 RepID=UPI0038635268|nr:ATP-grasp domain-containing protein [Streptomyces sp. NBC_01017]
MKNSWVVLIELHTSPGGARALPSAGQPLRSSSEHFLEAARARGHRTAVVTVDHDYYGDHFDHLVDAWLITDSTDPKAVQQTLGALDSQIAAVHSSVDSFVRIAAQVARNLGLRAPSPHGVGIARDKAKAREALADAGLENTRWAVLPADEQNLSSPIGYPCIVKPVDGAYSWDVALVSNDEDVQSLAQNHLARRYARKVEPKRQLLFEEHLEGPLFSAEGFIDGDELTIFGYSDRVMSAPPHFVELALRFSGEEPHPEADTFVRRTLDALGYDFGPFHLEFILTSDGPRLVELNARLVGAGMEQAIGYVSSIPLADFLVAKLTGDDPVVTFSSAVTELYLTAPQSGFLRKAEGLDKATRQPACHSAGLYYAYGEAVSDVIDSNSSPVGYVHATGEDREQSCRNAQQAARDIAFGISPL